MEAHPHLEARGLAIGYPGSGTDRVLARNLDLALHRGEFVCLLGPNGAGKSTLIRTLAGMQPPLAGSLRLEGEDFKSLSPRLRARRLSVVLTETIAVGMMDVEALVALGRHPYSGWLGGLDAEDRRQIDRAIAAAGAEPLRRRLVHELSDGERQKAAIARALAQEARVVLLDEPTAFLDLPRRVELMSTLRNLAHREGIALLLSTHDLELALRFADRFWMLDHEGGIRRGYPEALVLDGSFDRVFASENLDWDPQEGSFRAHPTPCLKVRLEGEGLERIWTARALQRLGFGLSGDEADAAFSVRIEKTGAAVSWKIRQDGRLREADSLAGLIDWIRSESRSPDPPAQG